MKKYLSRPFALFVYIGLIFIPFFCFRSLRMAGDDKVYVAQALEMVRDHRWFVQTLADLPDYYKGPLHYILLKIGTLTFGQNMWATLYMNFISLIIGAFSLNALWKRHYPEKEEWGFWLSTSFVTGVGVYAHAFASVMEVELCGLIPLCLLFLDRSKTGKDLLPFWILTGILGWLKSPLHSGFMGVSALLFFLVTGQLWKRLKQPYTYLTLAVGIAVGISAYLPPVFLDYDNWYKTYWLRESRYKGPSGEVWWSPLWPIFTFYLLPWLSYGWTGYIAGLTHFFRKNDEKLNLRLIALGVCTLLPSVCFFTWHDYRSQNYNLPMLSGMFLIIACLLSTLKDSLFLRVTAFLSKFVFAFVVLSAFALIFLIDHLFGAQIDTWWNGTFIFTLVAFAASVFFFIQKEKTPFSPVMTSWTLFPLYLCCGLVITFIGETEMTPLKNVISNPQNDGKKIAYYNVHRNLWSEWGYLAYMVKHPISGIHSEGDVQKSVTQKDIVLIKEEERLTEFLKKAKTYSATTEYEIVPWPRFRTHGKNDHGEPLWKDAITQKNIHLLKANQYILIPKDSSR